MGNEVNFHKELNVKYRVHKT